MKTISLWQPWATLIAIGAKQIETRSWDAKYVGPIAIHASKKLVREVAETMPFLSKLREAGYYDLTDLPRGRVVAICHLDRTTGICGGATEGFLGSGETVKSPEWNFGDYSPGRFAWMLSKIVKLENPVAWKGCQKWFDVPNDIIFQGMASPAHQPPPPSQTGEAK